MTFTSVTLNSVPSFANDSTAPVDNSNALAGSTLLGLLLLFVYASKKSKKQLRKLKRKLMWNMFKLKLKSLFKRGTATGPFFHNLAGWKIVLLIAVLLGLISLGFYFLTGSLIASLILFIGGAVFLLLLGSGRLNLK